MTDVLDQLVLRLAVGVFRMMRAGQLWHILDQALRRKSVETSRPNTALSAPAASVRSS